MRLFIISVLLVFVFPFITTDVVDSFNTCSGFFLDEKPPVVSGILDKSASLDNNRYKLICQMYKDAYRFATLYDATHKIPVFSAYKYTGKGDFKKRNHPFRKESALKDEQANDGDYKNNNMKMVRGHLFPRGHAADLESAKSTYTLTNVVPQEEHFNSGQWNVKEGSFKDEMDKNCLDNNNKVVAYVLTGAVPGDKKLNERVNIPSHMWMAFCCYNKNTRSWLSKAYCGTNEEKSTAVLTEERLDRLQTFLKEKWVKDVKLFQDKCK